MVDKLKSTKKGAENVSQQEGDKNAPVRYTARSYIMGHEVHCPLGTDNWVYADNGKPLIEEERPCIKCGLHATPEGHDPCIKNLPGVIAACCGHGTARGFVAFENGLVIRGDFEHIGPRRESSNYFTSKTLASK